MVYTITFNPAIDYIARVEKLVLGETNRTSAETIHPGGKGINVAIVLQRLGIDVVALGFTGGFTGEAIEEMVKKTGIKADFIHCEGNTRINVKLKGETETEINGIGVRIEEGELALLKEKLSLLKEGDWLVLAGSIPKGMPETIYADIMHDLKGVNVVVDATGNLLRESLKERPFLIKPNVQELGEIFGVEITSEEEIVRYAKELIALGAKNVVISMAGKGALMITERGDVMRCQPPKGKVIDSVGAGDSLIAGFIAGYIQTGSYEEAFHTGIAAGSATAFSVWLAEKDLVINLKEQIK